MVEEAAFRPIPCHRHPRPSASPGAHPIIPPTILSKSLGACASIAVQPRWGGRYHRYHTYLQPLIDY